MPPLVLDLGVRTRSPRRATCAAPRSCTGSERPDEAAPDLRASSLAPGPHRRSRSPRWPRGTQGRLEQLSAVEPRSAAVRLHLGLAYFWAGRDAEAPPNGVPPPAWSPTRSSPSAPPTSCIPSQAPGLPAFVPGFERARGARARLQPPAQLALLRRQRERAGCARQAPVRRRPPAARTPASRPSGCSPRRRGSRPRDAEAQVAAAVGRYRKEAPERAFSRLGPLTRRFPAAATVRFHLGLCLLWLGNLPEAKRQLLLARKAAPRLVDREGSEPLPGASRGCARNTVLKARTRGLKDGPIGLWRRASAAWKDCRNLRSVDDGARAGLR